MIEDYLPQVAILRPPISRSTLAEIFPDDIRTSLAGPLGATSFEYGPEAKRAHDRVDRSNNLEAITFRTTFPAQFRWYGLRPGMRMVEASEALLTLRAEEYRLPSQTVANSRVQRLWGTAPDGTEVGIKAVDGLIEEVTIAEAGYRVRRVEVERVSKALRAAHSARRQNENLLRNRWRSIVDDDDQMLLTWAAHIWPNDHGWSNEFVVFADWLMAVSQGDWHAAVVTWNWDYEIAPLLWVIRQPDCELATALHIFFGAGPNIEDLDEGRREWIEANYSVDLETFDLRMEIRKRIADGSIRNNTLGYDLSREVAAIATVDDQRLKRVLPNGFTVKQGGRIPERRTWGNGLPPFNLS